MQLRPLRLTEEVARAVGRANQMPEVQLKDLLLLPEDVARKPLPEKKKCNFT